MPTVGPWIQDADFEQAVVWDAGDATDVLVKNAMMDPESQLATSETSAEGPGAYPVGPYDDLEEMLAGVISSYALTATQWTAFSYGSGEVKPGFIYVARSSVTAGTSYTAVAAGFPSESQPNGVSPFYYWPPDHGVDQPEGAVGIEFEGGNDVSEWLAVELDPAGTELRGTISERFDQEPDTHEESTTVSGPFATHVRIGGIGATPAELPGILTAPGDYDVIGSSGYSKRPYGPIEQEPLQLSDYLSHTPGSVSLLAMNNPVFIPHSSPPDGLAGVWAWTYGWGWWETRYVWTLRPPRYRWIYDTVPIRQTTHRNDHLAGGAFQTWPPPTSEQLSNVTFGGYL